MSTTGDEMDLSVGLVENLLRNRFIGENTIAIVQNKQIAGSELLPGFGTKGSTRVEVLYDNVAKGGNCEVIDLLGLAENCEEKQVPIMFFCEMVWLDTEEQVGDINSSENLPNSFVIDPVENLSAFCNTVFNVTFENQQNGQLLGRGEGYLRFEKEQQ